MAIHKDVPCARDCEGRKPGCHDKCPKWQAYLIKRDERLAKRQKDREDCELYYHLVKKTNARILDCKTRLPKRKYSDG